MKVLPDVTEIPKKPVVSGTYVLPTKDDIPERDRYVISLKVV